MTDRRRLETVGCLPAIIKNEVNFYEGDLRYYFKILFHQAGNLSNPYHNFRHITHFLWLCSDAIFFYLQKSPVSMGSARERRNLLIAGIFHDFDHTGISSNHDIINIENALSALQRFCHRDDKHFIYEIEKLIRFTEYPHKQEEDVGIFGNVMRDADLAQCLSSSWIQQTIFGLADEAGMLPMEMLELQEKFLRNLHFETDWANSRFPHEIIAKKIVEVKGLAEILR